MADWPPEAWKGKLLTSASPLQVLPDLAVAIGLNESLMLQQLHYWTLRDGSDDGWIEKTIHEWAAVFPFWHRDTIKRTGTSLRERKLVEVDQRNGRRNSYRLRYDELEKIAGGQFAPTVRGQNAPINGADCTHQEGKMHPRTNKEQRKRQRKTKPRRGAPGADEAPLSHLLADLIAANDPDGQRPTVSRRWAEAEDRLQRLDGRSPAQIEVVIRWVQADEFWRSNVLSLPKLREKYPALVQKATQEAPHRNGKPASRTDDDVRRLLEAQKRLKEEGR